VPISHYLLNDSHCTLHDALNDAHCTHLAVCTLPLQSITRLAVHVKPCNAI